MALLMDTILSFAATLAMFTTYEVSRSSNIGLLCANRISSCVQLESDEATYFPGWKFFRLPVITPFRTRSISPLGDISEWNPRSRFSSSTPRLGSNVDGVPPPT